MPGFRKPYDPVRDRPPDRSAGRKAREYHLHLQTMEWCAEQMRLFFEKTERDLRKEGRGMEADLMAWTAVKVRGIVLREHETQRKALNRATKRNREAIEIEMTHTKRRADELNDLLDQIERAEKLIKYKAAPKQGHEHFTPRAQMLKPIEVEEEDP